MSQAHRRSRRGTGHQGGHAGSVILVIVIGTVCGVAGAAVQFKQRGGDMDKLVGRIEGSFDQLVGSFGGPDTSTKPGVKAAPQPPVKQAPKAPGVAAQPGKGEPQPVAADAAKADPVTPAMPIAHPVEDTSRAMREVEPQAEPIEPAPKPEPVLGPGTDDTANPSISSLPTDKQEAYKTLVNEANASYDKAVEHLKRSDPGTNPDSWQKENNLALDLLTRACNTYNQALDIHNDSSLLPRVQDTNFKRIFCMMRQINK
jgi:hypothetical protein